jgi:hypothetical protein
LLAPRTVPRPGAIGDTEEKARFAQFLRESSAEAAQNLGF